MPSGRASSNEHVGGIGKGEENSIVRTVETLALEEESRSAVTLAFDSLFEMKATFRSVGDCQKINLLVAKVHFKGKISSMGLFKIHYNTVGHFGEATSTRAQQNDNWLRFHRNKISLYINAQN